MKSVQVLAGGMSGAEVLRVGQTVRRPWQPWSRSVHEYLKHLKGQGITEVPEPQGHDGEGREVLSYLPGNNSGRPLTPVILSGDGLEQVGSLLRRIQKASEGFRCAPDSEWQFAIGAPDKGQSMAHGDCGPWNMLWEGGRLSGLIDWDNCHPGAPLDNFAVACWFLVPLQSDSRARANGFEGAIDRGLRLHRFANACGLEVGTLLDAVLVAQETQATRLETLGKRGLEPWRTFWKCGNADLARIDSAWLLEHGGKLL